MTPEVCIEYPADGVATVRLDAPHRKNALVGAMARRLVEVLRAVDADQSIGAVVITGGQDSFCAGAHRDLLAAVGAGEDPDADEDLRSVYEIFSTIRDLEAPTVAAVCGPAVGAGLNIALACGTRVVGENAYLRSMFVANSIHPAGGHLRMLRDIGGRALAVQMAVFDAPLNAEQAVARGLALGPWPTADVEAEALRLAVRAASNPRVARWINRSISDVANLNDAAAHDLEAAAQRTTLRSHAAGEPWGNR